MKEAYLYTRQKTFQREFFNRGIKEFLFDLSPLKPINYLLFKPMCIR